MPKKPYTPGQDAERNKHWREANRHRLKPKVHGVHRKAEDPEVHRERNRIYYQAHKLEAAEKKQRRRARKHDALGQVSRGIIKRLMALQGGRCAYSWLWCPADLETDGFHLDHIVPLARGGRHEDANLQLLCPSCNLRKGFKDASSFEDDMLLLAVMKREIADL